MKPLILAIGFVVFVSGTAVAQSPYAGMQTRTIKSLSNEQIADLKAGRGMGLALAAELNGYPGPIHLLELSEKLELSADQKTRIKPAIRFDESGSCAAGRKGSRPRGGLGPAICLSFCDFRKPERSDHPDRSYSRRTPKHPSQIPSPDRADSVRRTNEKIFGAQRLRLRHAYETPPHDAVERRCL